MNLHDFGMIPTLSYMDRLRYVIIRDFTAKWELNDPAHRLEHFANVERCALVIDDRLNLGQDKALILLAAFFHDLFAWSRTNHHLLSETYVRTTDYHIFKGLLPDEREMVALACGQHRASYKGEFSNVLCELINAADRDLPGDVEAMMRRSLAYNLAQGHSQEEADRIMRTHLKEKFGVNGYARYPKIYQDAFGDELEQQRQDIMNI